MPATTMLAEAKAAALSTRHPPLPEERRNPNTRTLKDFEASLTHTHTYTYTYTYTKYENNKHKY